MPRYLLSCIHPPGQIPLTQEFQWDDTDEIRWTYGNIASSTKILTASRMGAPITVLQWLLKRYNSRLASYTSNAEGSTRMLCDMCGKFQVLAHKPSAHITQQGCSMCISKINLMDPSLLVRLLIYFHDH